jgi:Abnormal spindle-like microcephaly-assoc'd, ASPM-SPD-2-Hydin
MRRRLPLILSLLAVLLLSSVAVSSAGSGPAVFSPSPVHFGNVQAGDTGTVTVTVTNSGDNTMAVNDAGSDVTFGGANPGAFGKTNDTCAGVAVAPGHTCTLDVTFSPGSATDYAATLTLNSDSAGPDQVDLAGTGTPVPAPAIQVTPSPFDFGNHKVGAPPADSQTFTVTNIGNADLDITGTTVQGSAFSPGTTNTCSGTTLTPNHSCAVAVQFLPGAAGLNQGTLTIISNQLAPYPVQLAGTGTVPEATVPDAVAFATPLNVPLDLSVTLKNTGDAPMEVQHATLSGSGEFTNTGGGNCGSATLAPDQSCSAQIRFLPTAGGDVNGTVSFVDDAPNSPQQVPITGTVLVPGIDPSPTSLAFGDVTDGHLSPSAQVTITNTGKADLHISSVVLGGLNAKAFKLAGQTCTDAAIAPDTSCTADVAFAPVHSGSRVATLTFVNDAGPDQAISLSGQGTPPADATAVRAASGCGDVKLTWNPPDGQFFRKVVIVRRSRTYPQDPGDGTTVPHSGQSVVDTDPKQFHTYRYTLFSQYGSYNGEHIVYSAGVHVRARTGRICAPRNNSVIGDLTPKVDWLRYTGARSYAFILQRSGKTIWVHYVTRSEFQIPSSWTYLGQRRQLARGSSYTFYLYAYTLRRPNGLAIGSSTWLNK